MFDTLSSENKPGEYTGGSSDTGRAVAGDKWEGVICTPCIGRLDGTIKPWGRSTMVSFSQEHVRASGVQGELHQGDEVRFDVIEGEDGGLSAINLERIPRA